MLKLWPVLLVLLVVAGVAVFFKCVHRMKNGPYETTGFWFRASLISGLVMFLLICLMCLVVGILAGQY